MRIIVTLILITLLLPLFHFNASLSHACSCISPRSVDEELLNARAVFEGKVKSISNNESGEKSVTFEVTRYWKGETPSQMTITTAQDSAGCGYTFERNESYLVFANSPKDLTQLNVSLCSRTKSLIDARDDIAELGNAKTPINTYNPIDSIVEKQLNWAERLFEWVFSFLNW